MTLMSVAEEIQQLGNALRADVIAWGVAAVGLAIAVSAAMWVMRLLRS